MSLSLSLRADGRAAPAPASRGAGRPNAERSIRLAALRVPLAAKLVGANVAVLAILLALWNRGHLVARAGLVEGTVLLLLAHFGLVLVALRPIRELEAVAARVWRGDLGARVDRSVVADADVLRVGSMFNILLDSLAADRARMRELAADVIAAGDRERAALARELHDSTAQHVAALLLQLSAAARDSRDPLLADRLQAARDSTEEILDEMRRLSHTLHPSVLDDLGLEAALRKLARDASHGIGVVIDVTARLAHRLPTNVEAVLYRVAQEATRNATKHAAARHVRLDLFATDADATLDVHDDGTGFDLVEADRTRRGMGLLSMRERVALVDGSLQIKTAMGDGTTVSATVPLITVPLTTEPGALHGISS